MRLQSFSASVALTLLAGCAVGPDFKKPAVPDVSSYTAQPLSAPTATANVTGGDAQRFIQAADISGEWWTAFHAPALIELVALALKNNADLEAANAALRSSHNSALAARGGFFPQISAGFNATRQLTPAGALAPTPADNSSLYNLFTPQLSVSFVPDVFGLTRRTVEAANAQAQATHYAMLATYTTLVNNVVSTAIQEAAVREQVDATRQMIDAETKALNILQYQLDKGYASGADFAAQKSALAAATASLPPLIKQQVQLHDQLAVLTGRFPAQMPPSTLRLADLTLPADLPVSLPADLVAQRPDILQAQANLHAASAAIGIAIANRLPNITLSGAAGNSALAFGSLFTPGTDFWSIGAGLAAPIFQGGTLLYQERAGRGTYDQAAAQYRGTVLTAFQNVADTLTALQQDGDGLKSAAAADDAAKASLDITQYQLQAGYAATLALVTSEQAYSQAHIGLLQAQASRYADTAALFQALGGGWWHRTDLNGDKNDK